MPPIQYIWKNKIAIELENKLVRMCAIHIKLWLDYLYVDDSIVVVHDVEKATKVYRNLVQLIAEVSRYQN